jgi:hypothetical protein
MNISVIALAAAARSDFAFNMEVLFSKSIGPSRIAGYAPARWNLSKILESAIHTGG